jgi:hypothetical protein
MDIGTHVNGKLDYRLGKLTSKIVEDSDNQICNDLKFYVSYDLVDEIYFKMNTIIDLLFVRDIFMLDIDEYYMGE